MVTEQHRAGKAGQDRLLWVDVAKGLGIIAVAIAHVWTSGTVRDALYAFHMPLFFLLAGYVARPRPMGAFLRGQFWSMLVPYVCFLLLITLMDQAIEHMRGHLPIFRSWEAGSKALLIGGSELKGPFTIFWFIPCLMVARIVQNGLMLRWQDPRDVRWMVSMALALILGLWLGARTDFSPWGLLAVPVALVLLWLGALWRMMEGRDHWLMAAGVAVTVAALLFWKPVPLGMKIGDYGVPGLSLVLAVMMSLALCAFSRMLSGRRIWGGPLLAGIGRRSLVIMYVHVPVIHYLTPYYGKPVLLGLSLMVSLIFYEILVRLPWGRRFFLGRKAHP